MDINNLVLSDAALSVIDDGAWVGDFKNAPGVRLKVRGFRSKEARKLMEQKQAAARSKTEQLTEQQLAEIMQEVLAESVLLDWDGITDNGKPVSYDRDLATKWLTSRNGEAFAGLVLDAAQRIDRQASDYVDSVSKN